MTGNPNVTILVVDDEPQIRRFIRVALEAQQYIMIEASNGEEALSTCAMQRPDLVILDLGLPDMDGKEVLRRIREWSQVPIIVLSVRAKETDKIEVLDLGADDYVTKPFGIGELMARIRTSLRHRPQAKSGDDTPIFITGTLKVDLHKRQVWQGENLIHLSKKEYQILAFFVQYAGLVLTHQQILKEVWGEAYAHETEYLRVFVRQLRQKIEPDPKHPRYILTEPGIGYRLQCVEA